MIDLPGHLVARATAQSMFDHEATHGYSHGTYRGVVHE